MDGSNRDRGMEVSRYAYWQDMGHVEKRVRTKYGDQAEGIIVHLRGAEEARFKSACGNLMVYRAHTDTFQRNLRALEYMAGLKSNIDENARRQLYADALTDLQTIYPPGVQAEGLDFYAIWKHILDETFSDAGGRLDRHALAKDRPITNKAAGGPEEDEEKDKHAEFDESKHKRDESGKWTAGAVAQRKEHEANHKEHQNQHAEAVRAGDRDQADYHTKQMEHHRKSIADLDAKHGGPPEVGGGPGRGAGAKHDTKIARRRPAGGGYWHDQDPPTPSSKTAERHIPDADADRKVPKGKSMVAPIDVNKAPLEDSYGFRGNALDHLSDDDQHSVWEHAVGTIAQVHGVDPQVAHNYLRSPYGRHLADHLGTYNNTPLNKIAANEIKDRITDASESFVKSGHLKKIAQQTKDGHFDD